MPTLSLREHLKRARSKVDPKNCARSKEKATKAATKKWEQWYADKGLTYVPKELREKVSTSATHRAE